MNTRSITTAIAAAASVTLLTQCVIEAPTDTSRPAPYQSGGQAPADARADADQAYQAGVRLGMNDGASGQSRSPQRHQGQYPSGESDAFYSGYEKGYNQGMR